MCKILVDCGASVLTRDYKVSHCGVTGIGLAHENAKYTLQHARLLFQSLNTFGAL